MHCCSKGIKNLRNALFNLLQVLGVLYSSQKIDMALTTLYLFKALSCFYSKNILCGCSYTPTLQ